MFCGAGHAGYGLPHRRYLAEFAADPLYHVTSILHKGTGRAVGGRQRRKKYRIIQNQQTETVLWFAPSNGLFSFNQEERYPCQVSLHVEHF